MSTSPVMRTKSASPIVLASDANDAPAPPRQPLSKRLPHMSDEGLLSLQRSATRIASDAEHPKKAKAAIALPRIDAEIARRTGALLEQDGGIVALRGNDE